MSSWSAIGSVNADGDGKCAPTRKRSPRGLRRLTLDLLDQRILVEAEDGFFLDRLARCYEPALGAAVYGNERAIDLRVRIERAGPNCLSGEPAWAVTTDPAGTLEQLGHGTVHRPTVLAGALNLWAVDTTSRHYIFHAGAVARDGRAILLPAGPFGGKSTLTAGLVGRGFELLSDEVGAIEIASGRIVGYPRKMSIRFDVLHILGLQAAGHENFGDDACMVSVGEMGGVRAPAPVALGLIVLPEFTGSPHDLELLRPGRAVVALMEASCSQARFKSVGLDLVIDLALRLPCYRLKYTDLNAALDQIERCFAKAAGSTA